LSYVTDILSIDEDAALILLQVVKAVKKAEDCRLARSRLADEGYRSSLGDAERDATKCILAATVRKADVIYDHIESILNREKQ
jgi:hypothetical protein